MIIRHNSQFKTLSRSIKMASSQRLFYLYFLLIASVFVLASAKPFSQYYDEDNDTEENLNQHQSSSAENISFENNSNESATTLHAKIRSNFQMRSVNLCPDERHKRDKYGICRLVMNHAVDIEDGDYAYD